MGRGLVLGGGGLVGMAYHAGVLKALDDAGLDVTGADVLVGTSAGSIMASYLAAGWTPQDFYSYAHGNHRDAARTAIEHQGEVRDLFEPLYSGLLQRVMRSTGSAFAAVSSRGWIKPLRGRVPIKVLRKAFPSGLYSTEGTRQRLERDLPAEWPREGLYISAVELYSAERVAFGMAGAPDATLPQAVLASTSIPGIFPPVRIGGRQYVDGGIYSATSLDLAAGAGCQHILCIAPLGYMKGPSSSPFDPRTWSPMLVRSPFARTLRREVSQARARGIDVLVIRPTLAELVDHGTNSMRYVDRAAITDAAVDSTKRLLDGNSTHPVVKAFAATEGAGLRKGVG